MPNKRAALKELRKSKARHLRNIGFESELKTLKKKLQILISAKQQPEAQTLLKTLVKKIDAACSKGLLHANTAARNKSSLMRQFASAKA